MSSEAASVEEGPSLELHGGCHCRKVRWRFTAPASLPVVECNCSCCSMKGFLHLVVSKEQFQLDTGEGDLTEYRFNTGKARHLFCRTCGVESFYHPRSHPDGISVNARCVDGGVPPGRRRADFNGQDWEGSISKLNPHHAS